MALRFPLYWDRPSNSLKTMNEAQRQEIVSAAIYEYGVSAAAGFGSGDAVHLQVFGSGGNLGTINDTRLQAGTSTTHPSTFIDAPNTSTVTEAYSKINQNGTYSNPSYGYPLYYDSGSIKHMTRQDFMDTFIYPAIDLLVDGTDRPGTFRIHTASTLAGHTSLGVVFVDTRADASAYTSSSIPETQDQPTTITTYYLMRTDVGTNPTHKYPLVGYTAGGNPRFSEVAHTAWRFQISKEIGYCSQFDNNGYRINYGLFDGSTHTSTGQNKGSGMVDTKLNSQTTSTHQVNINDYRTQDFPSGSPTTQNTTFLRIRKGV